MLDNWDNPMARVAKDATLPHASLIRPPVATDDSHYRA